MPGLIAAGHHSIADWDFELPDTYYSLSPDEYVSAPTSLRFSGLPANKPCTVLCRIPETLCLPQGEVRTYHHTPTKQFFPAVFRNQAPLGSSHYWDAYVMGCFSDKARFGYWSGGVYWQISEQPCPTPVDQWNHWRIFWYNGKTPAELPSLCVDLYREITGEWVKQGTTFYHPANLWKDSEINRCGFYDFIRSGEAHFVDNTEIWGPV